MSEINLLPWRESKREYEKKQFITLLIINAVFAIVMIFAINYYARSLVDSQNARNQMIQREIDIFNKQILQIKHYKEIRDGLISRMQIVQKLQATRTLTVHLFDEIIRVMPDGVYLTNVKRTNDKITMQGYTESNSNISILMRNIQLDPWMKDPVLTEIKKNKEVKTDSNNEFTLSFILKPNLAS